MKKNGISIQPLPCLIFCSLFLVNYSIICSAIEMTNFTTKQIKVYSQEELFARSFFLIINQLEQYPTTIIRTFTRVNKILYTTIHASISEIFTMIKEAKKYRTEYDCTALRKNWLVNEIYLLDKPLHFQVYTELGKKYVLSCNNVTKGNLNCLNKCVNYLSLKTELPVYTLSQMFRCLKYLKYYTFEYGQKFNLYTPHGTCILS
jgi:hypothetical protein